MKIETRGKYPGVKVHLDEEECQALMAYAKQDYGIDGNEVFDICVAGQAIAKKAGLKIKELLSKEPDLLTERTPEAIIAILAKESEKAALQLAAIKAGADWKKINPDLLQAALLKHVHHD